jgi:hypothetical protein
MDEIKVVKKSIIYQACKEACKGAASGTDLDVRTLGLSRLFISWAIEMNVYLPGKNTYDNYQSLLQFIVKSNTYPHTIPKQFYESVKIFISSYLKKKRRTD